MGNSKSGFGKKTVLIGMILLVVALICVSPYSKKEVDDVVLNELVCYNDTVVYDTIGNYHDYIEIYNPTESIKDIGGYYLSDDKDDLLKYALAEGTSIESGGYLVIWADIWTEDVLTEGADSYTGFSLRENETIYLSDSKGKVIDKVKLPMGVGSDIAYSRVEVSESRWKTTEATPGYQNSLEMPKEQIYLQEEVVFSVSSGFYNEAFYLELETDDRCDIYYTLDGSMPTVESIKYETAILVDDASDNENYYSAIEDISLLGDELYIPSYKVEKATIIRAIAVDKSGLASKDYVATYFVNYDEKEGFGDLATISIVTDPENLFGYEEGIYVTGKVWDLNKQMVNYESDYWLNTSPTNYKCEGIGWQREATVHYFDEAGLLKCQQQVGIRNHGCSSLLYNQKSFNLYALPESDGNQYLLAGIFGGKNERTLMLRNGGGGDCYSTKIRDVYTQQLVKDRSLAVADFEPCQVFLNGEYWGLYMLQERVSESMVSNQFDVEEDNVIIIKNDSVIAGEDVDLQNWESITNFVKENDMSLENNYNRVEQMIDVQSCIDHYCFQIYVANSDSLANNLATWRVRTLGDGKYEDGKWRWILFDIDVSTNLVEGRTWPDIDSFTSGGYFVNVLQDEFFLSLLRNDEFKERFVVSFMDMANYNFDSDKTNIEIDELSNKLSEAMVASQKRFFLEDYSAQTYEDEVFKFRRFFEVRYGYITAYMKEDLRLLGELVEVRVKKPEIMGGVVKFNTLMLDGTENYEGYYYSDYDINLSAQTKEGYRFFGWDINGEVIRQEELVLELYKEYEIKPIWERVE